MHGKLRTAGVAGAFQAFLFGLVFYRFYCIASAATSDRDDRRSSQRCASQHI
jgi:hypothetical protein